eukprot:TRINITY_DN58476_c0_g1_i1.p1 TRINITY_DN58476_c0_g1~~TRINITY_DN58476_c0_g1_i1.p1  ORF type:complete len:793 (+),score=168.87 TRINITY_DN58476_c0_g1_i1:61-2439(+)
MCLQSSEDRAQSALTAVAEFATVASQVQHDELRSASLKVAHEALAQCESHGQRCVCFLLEALQKSAEAGACAVQDVVWMVYKVARKSDTARAWILQAGGIQVIQVALLRHRTESELLENGIWTVYALDGIRGLAELLERCRGTSPEEIAIRVALCWAVYQLVCGRTKRETFASDRTLEVAPPANLILLVMEALSRGGLDTDTLWACCRALDTLVDKDSRLGCIVISRGGGQLLVQMLRSPAAMGPAGEDLRKAIACLMITLVEGNTEAMQALRMAGAARVLVEEGLQGNRHDAEAAMWALGAIDGLGAVLQAIQSKGPGNLAVLKGGVHAITECTHAAEERGEVALLPAALSLLLDLVGQQDVAASGILRWCIKALGAILAIVAPHAPPGRAGDVDRGVEALIAQVSRRVPSTSNSQGSAAAKANLASEESWGDSIGWANSWGGDDYDEPCPVAAATEAAAEAIGRLAMSAPEWRGVLKRFSMEALTQWIRSGNADRRLQKYLFWAAASMSGLPFVAAEMQLHMADVGAVDAALCTIIDILDEDIIAGEYTLAGAERGEEADLPPLLGLAMDAMRQHSSAAEVQSRGATCIGLLVPNLSSAMLHTIAPAAVSAVMTGFKRFPRRNDVAHGCLSALRALCGLCRRRSASERANLEVVLAAAVRAEGAQDFVKEALDIFGSYGNSAELLEDAAAVYAQLVGVEALLKRLMEEPCGSQLRVAGLKALFEEGRADAELFTARAATAAVQTCEKMVMEFAEKVGSASGDSDPQDSTRLHEVASLLSGLCQGRLMAAS